MSNTRSAAVPPPIEGRQPNAPVVDAATTDRAVRDLYDAFPYPDGPPALRSGFDVRQVLSRGRLTRADTGALGRRLRVLDAGCGRGVGLLAEASVQPDVDYVGIDLNRTALEEARRACEARGLRNVRFRSVDLVTLEGLDVPDGGFDLIRSSGVVHHLDDPAGALARLATVLAPHGVLDLMVYGRVGRADILRVARAVQAGTPPEASVPERLGLARELCRELANEHDPSCPWNDAARQSDAEFVDRYLHPRERNYGVVEFVELITDAGLAPLEFCDGDAWDPAHWIADPQRLAAFAERAPLDQLRALEQFAAPLRLEALACHPTNGPRPPIAAGSLANTVLRVHPEARFEVTTRATPAGVRVEQVTVARRDQPAETLPPGPLALAAWILASQGEPFEGAALVAELVARGVADREAEGALIEAVARDLVFAPHPCEEARGA